MPDYSADPPSLKHQGLFPGEAEVARRLSQSEKRWRGVARQLEREGLPRVDPIMRGRNWPAIVAFFHARYGVRVEGDDVTYPSPPDGEEHWDAR